MFRLASAVHYFTDRFPLFRGRQRVGGALLSEVLPAIRLAYGSRHLDLILTYPLS